KSAAVEHAKRSSCYCIAPLRHDLVRRCCRRHSGSVCTRGSYRLTVRDNESRQRAVRRPSHSHTALRPTQSVGHPFFATRQNERERARPKTRGEHRCVTGQAKPEPGDHLARSHEEEKWFAGRAAFELHELLHRVFIHGPAKSIDGFGRVSEDLPCREMGERSIDGSLDFLRRPERHHHRLGLHSRKILSASANEKSVSSVIFSARSLPRTTTTGNPICSHNAESSVAIRSASRASR